MRPDSDRIFALELRVLELERRLTGSRPTLPSLDEEDVTLNGSPVPVHGGQVLIPKSDFNELKELAGLYRAGKRAGKSAVQKALTTVIYGALIGVAGLLGAQVHAYFARPAVVLSPPVVIQVDGGR